MDEPPSSSLPQRPAAESPGDHEIAVLVEDAGWTGALEAAEAVAGRAAGAVLSAEADGEPLELTILLTGDAAVRDLNARYRGKDRPTNVLSFPAGLEAGLPGEPRLLGDLALAFGTCSREAAEQGKPLADHLTHLVVHGTLHLLGYDHEDDAEAEAMEDRERALLAAMGLPDPYAERGGDAPGRPPA